MTALLGGDTDPAWSPDGRRIVFTRSDSLRMASGPYVDNLFTLDARGGKALRQLTKSGGSTQAGVVAGWQAAGVCFATWRDRRDEFYGRELEGARTGVSSGLVAKRAA